MHALIRMLFRVAADGLDAYEAHKRERAAIDFVDQEPSRSRCSGAQTCGPTLVRCATFAVPTLRCSATRTSSARKWQTPSAR